METFVQSCSSSVLSFLPSRGKVFFFICAIELLIPARPNSLCAVYNGPPLHLLLCPTIARVVLMTHVRRGNSIVSADQCEAAAAATALLPSFFEFLHT